MEGRHVKVVSIKHLIACTDVGRGKDGGMEESKYICATLVMAMHDLVL